MEGGDPPSEHMKIEEENRRKGNAEEQRWGGKVQVGEPPSDPRAIPGLPYIPGIPVEPKRGLSVASLRVSTSMFASRSLARSLPSKTGKSARAFSTTIKEVKGRFIIDSRGNPTVEVDMWLSDGQFTRGAVPSGASTGVYEALELRDGGDAFMGKGVSKAVDNINKVIGPAIIGMDPTDQQKIDDKMFSRAYVFRSKNLMDPRTNGAGPSPTSARMLSWRLTAHNLGVSIATCRAGSLAKGIPLYKHIADLAGNPEIVMPVPSFNIINGGSHAGNGLAMQEFMVHAFFL
eukprot:1379102-Amorphochlora_amoeboformis.AAC.3